MRTTARRLALALTCVWLIGGAVAAQEYLSPLDVVAGKDGKVLLVTAHTAGKILVVDPEAGTVVKSIAAPRSPSGLALSPDGATLYVASAVPSGALVAIDVQSGAVKGSAAVGHTATAPVVSPDGAVVYVLNRFSNSVSIVEAASLEEKGRIGVLREPVAAALSPDGKTLVVANHLPAGPADGAYTAAAVSIIDTESRTVAATLELPNGSSSLRGVCVAPAGDFAYVTHVLSRYQLPTTQLERGWMNTNALTVIDVRKRAYVNTVLLDDVDLGAANPWGVAVTADGAFVCVTHAGTHEVSVIDRKVLHERLDAVARGERVTEVSTSVDEVPNDLSFLVDVRRRLRLTGNGPRGIALVGTTAYTAEYFTDTLGVVDIVSKAYRNAKSLALGPETPLTEARIGERHFHDAALCFQFWQSCASCHPDARVDGLNWDLLNDGIGNPKNTKSMLFAHVTPPSMMTGVRATAEAAVRSGIRFIQFAVRPEEDAVAIDAYLKALEPVPSPHLVNGALSESALRGKKVFEKAECASCHSGEYFTHLELVIAGTGRGRDADVPFDTPTLKEVWRTAPYLYDGRAKTMREVLVDFNTEDRHGVTSTLSPEELADLIEYVLSL